MASGYFQIHRTSAPIPEWLPHEYLLKNAAAAGSLPTEDVPVGSKAYTADGEVKLIFNGESWVSGEFDGSVIAMKDSAARTEINNLKEEARNRVESLDDTVIAAGDVVEAVGIPAYVSSVAEYAAYGITDTGWYCFARVKAKSGVTVGDDLQVTGAAGYIAEAGEDHVDVAVRFGVTAESQVVTIDWGDYTDRIVFTAPDLGIRNLDYRTTFYVYDAAPFVTWAYALTTDTTFVADKKYFVKSGDEYLPAEVTAGEAVAADTYYNHSKITIEGLKRNITYRLDEIIDCPMEFILPEIEDDTHGCWFEIRLQHAGSYSMTLVPPSSDVKVATEHTQAESAGINMIDLHYTSINGVKIWRFMNTHSSIPT